MDTNLDFQKKKYSRWSMDLRESRLTKVSELMEKLKPGKMLDLACSGGEFSSQFLELGWQVYGLDISSAKVREATRLGLQARIWNLEKKLPFKDRYFDLVFMGEIIEHLIDTTFFLREAHRVLKKGGRLILTTPNLASLENRLRLLIGMQPLWVDFKMEDMSGHIRAYTWGELKKQLEESGFKIEKFLGNFVPLWQLRFNDITVSWLAKTGYWFPGMSQGMIVQAVKTE